MRPEALAFLPQLALSVFGIPYVLAEDDLASAMLAQTLAFVAFNKVCTSQVRQVVCENMTRMLIDPVFSLVHGAVAVLFAKLVSSKEALAGSFGFGVMGRWTG